MRETWADKAKFLGITLMLIGHNDIANHNIFDFIYSFHMSLFFILSGFFASTKRTRYNLFFKHNVKGLIIPYVLFYILSLPFGYIVRYVNWEANNFSSLWDFILRPIIGLLTVKTTDFSININGPTWFLIALFFVKNIFYFATQNKYFSNTILVLTALLSLIALIILKRTTHIIYFRFDCALLGYPFYVIGYFLRKANIINLLKTLPTYKHIFYSFLCFLFCYYIGKLNGHVEFSAASYGHNMLYMFLTSLTGFLGTIFISMAIPDNKILLKLGAGTLVILGLHSQIQTMIKYIFKFLFDIPTTSYPLYIAIIIVCITLLCHIPLINFYNKLFNSSKK